MQYFFFLRVISYIGYPGKKFKVVVVIEIIGLFLSIRFVFHIPLTIGCSYRHFSIASVLPAPTEMAASLCVPRKLCSICFFYMLFLTLVPQVILGFITHSREELLNIRAKSTHHHYDQEYDSPEADPVFCLPPRTMDRIPAGDPKQ